MPAAERCREVVHMAVRQHVRSFLSQLDQAPPWDPTALGHLLGQVPNEARIEWTETTDGLRVGHGAVAMLRRVERPLPNLADAADFESFILCICALRIGQLVASGYDPSPQDLHTATSEGPRWLTNLLRMEPDFLDELMLQGAVMIDVNPAFAQTLEAQAAILQSARQTLQAQSNVLEGRTTLVDRLRGLLGAGPDLSNGGWMRWMRAIVTLALLDAKD